MPYTLPHDPVGLTLFYDFICIIISGLKMLMAVLPFGTFKGGFLNYLDPRVHKCNSLLHPVATHN